PDLLDLLLVEEKLAGALGLVAERRPGELGDVHPLEDGLAVLDRAPRVAEVGRAVAEHLHLAAHEREPGLEGLAELVLEARAPVPRDQLLAGLLLLLGHRRDGYTAGCALSTRRADLLTARRPA